MRFGHAADGQIVALGCAAGEHDFARCAPMAPAIVSRARSTASRLPAEGMARAAGVAILLGEKRQHLRHHPRIDPRRGMVVHVNRQFKRHERADIEGNFNLASTNYTANESVQDGPAAIAP